MGKDTHFIFKEKIHNQYCSKIERIGFIEQFKIMYRHIIDPVIIILSCNKISLKLTHQEAYKLYDELFIQEKCSNENLKRLFLHQEATDKGIKNTPFEEELRSYLIQAFQGDYDRIRLLIQKFEKIVNLNHFYRVEIALFLKILKFVVEKIH